MPSEEYLRQESAQDRWTRPRQVLRNSPPVDFRRCQIWYLLPTLSLPCQNKDLIRLIQDGSSQLILVDPEITSPEFIPQTKSSAGGQALCTDALWSCIGLHRGVELLHCYSVTVNGDYARTIRLIWQLRMSWPWSCRYWLAEIGLVWVGNNYSARLPLLPLL